MATDYSDMEFDGQRDGEKVIIIFRRHKITTWRGIMRLVLFAVLGAIPMLIWRGDIRMFYVWLVMLGIGVIDCAYIIMLWHFSYYLVTNQRIRQIRQTSLFKKTVVDLGIDKIQSISYQIPNMFGSLLKFGTILIQTSVGNLTITMAERPEETCNILQDQTNFK